nr:MAG TPA: hypothetical protein [Caudoviricetes sp.]
MHEWLKITVLVIQLSIESPLTGLDKSVTETGGVV